MPAALPLTGFNTFLGSCWAYVPRHTRTQTSLPPRRFLALVFFYLAKLLLILRLLWIILCQQLKQL